MKMYRCVWLVPVLLLSGCAGMADMTSKLGGLGQISEEVQSFDGATVVEMSPAFVYSDGATFGVTETKLGARWSSKAPAHVALVLTYRGDVASGRSYMNFSGVDINIDGTISSYKIAGTTAHDSSGFNSVSRTIYTESSNVVIVPMAVLERMLSAKDCRLRFHTSKGFEDGVFTVARSSAGQGMAIISLREFVGRVKAKTAMR